MRARMKIDRIADILGWMLDTLRAQKKQFRQNACSESGSFSKGRFRVMDDGLL
jgi:hypothetical protein